MNIRRHILVLATGALLVGLSFPSFLTNIQDPSSTEELSQVKIVFVDRDQPDGSLRYFTPEGRLIASSTDDGAKVWEVQPDASLERRIEVLERQIAAEYSEKAAEDLSSDDPISEESTTGSTTLPKYRSIHTRYDICGRKSI